jgi:hypothetical protein
MSIKLLAFDLDGTLLDDSKAVPYENILALRAAAEKNILTVPASGRIFRFMPEPVRTQLSARYFITTNGGEVYDAVSDSVLYSAEIPLQRALDVLDHFDTVDGIYDCYADNAGYMSRAFMEKADDYFLDPVLNAMLHSYTLKTRTPVDDLRGFMTARGGSLQKLQMFFRDPEERLHQLDFLPRLFPDLVISSSLANNIEVNSAEATKGQALAALCEKLGIDRAEVMAFGDGLNDLDMLQFAGVPIAMGNADPLIREKAAYITASNNEAGLAKALIHFGLAAL